MGLTCQCPMDRFRFFVDHDQQNPCWSLWLPASLLPVTDRVQLKPVALGKSDLWRPRRFRMALTSTTAGTCTVCLSPCGIALGIGQGILQPARMLYRLRSCVWCAPYVLTISVTTCLRLC